MTSQDTNHSKPTSHLLSTRANRRQVVAGAGLAASSALLGPGNTGASSLNLQDAPGALPTDLALVTSPRLPLWEITSESAARVLDGSAARWSEVGCPLPVPIRRVAIDGTDSLGMPVEETVAGYEALVIALDESPGTVAVAPVAKIDSRVSALRIDGADPLAGAATDSDEVFHVGVVGDMIPGRNVNIHIRGYDDYLFPWRRVAPLLSGFDFTFGNFECVISDSIPPPEDNEPNALDFVVGSAATEGLLLAGFDALSLANNHSIYNGSGWGLDGFIDTINALDAAGIPRFGAGMNLDEARAAHVAEVGGKTIALIGIDGVTANVDFPGPWAVPVNVGATATEAGTNPLITDQVLGDIETLAGQYDIVIPFFHMGEQYRWTLSEWAVDLCRAAIDAGAATALTSHPHVTQGMEWYRNKPLFYGLGNFIYDQMFTVDTAQGHILDLTFRGSDIVGFRMHGIEIEDFTQPRLLGPSEQAAFMDRIWRSHDVMRRPD